ncbi:putative aminohydrolase SsnA [Metaclostridioides mangenotii]|uniref:Selenium metabolism protein SsnA n=1 Tax=Metaclostridioides mangenotii TaxID=1540 RepID=A0ABS4EAQ8_9FIRM|nr:putative aminohydrolase SsnA [Clostridioides mangenotii]MBP1855026.1 putative selenium metabolism protein SsnA [Clostridioides mangenotii]
MLLVGNGKVITQDSLNPFLTEGCVVIDDNKIADIGSTADMKAKYPNSEFIDAKGKIIMPGLINSHMHIYSSFARGMAVPGEPAENFIEILERLWWMLDKKLTLEDTKYSAYATYLECIRNGVTTVFDHHASPNAIEGSLFAISDAAKDLGIRTCLCYEVSDRDGGNTMDQGIKENIDFIKYAQKDDTDMQKGMFGLHAAFTLSDDTLNKCATEMAGLKDVGYHVHVAEGMADVDINLEKYGKRPAQRLNDFGVLGDKTLAVHCLYVDDNEVKLLKESNTFVVHNPESNMGNAVGCCPAIEFINEGIEVGLGTDGYTADILESQKVANIIHRHRLQDPRPGFMESTKMLFDTNQKIAKAYYKNDLGILRKGAYADVIVVDYNPHTPLNENTIAGHTLFGLSGKCVDTTIVNGKVLMKDRVIVSADEDKILAKSRELSQNIWNRN